LLSVLQVPAAALVFASLGSGIANGVVFAPSKKRSSFVWGLKGLMGGPMAVQQLQGLDELKTFGESEA